MSNANLAAILLEIADLLNTCSVEEIMAWRPRRREQE